MNSGIVAGGYAFVAEIAVDFVNALKAADGQALQVQFGRYTQIKVKIERVVMGHERFGGGATGDVMHHRRFDFQEALRVEPVADR